MRFAAIVLLISAFAFAASVVTGQYRHVAQVANIVGVGAVVPPNPINTMAEQLAQREGELNEWERDLAAREAQQSVASRELMDILALSVGAIAALLGLNYYLDWRRQRTST